MYMMGVVWFLSREFPNKRLEILEIGSWVGASTLLWGEALELYANSKGRITCVDFWTPHHDTVVNKDSVYRDMNLAAESGEAYDTFLSNTRFLPNEVEVIVKRGDSKAVLPLLENLSYDLIYIDGDHTYRGVSEDIKNCKSLLKQRGVISGDDLEIQAHVFQSPIDIVEPHLDRDIHPETQSNFHPGVTRAVSENFGPVSSWCGFWAMQKNDSNWSHVSLDGFPMSLPSFLPIDEIIKLKTLFFNADLISK